MMDGLFRRMAAALLVAFAVFYGTGVGLTGSLDLSARAVAQTQGAVPGQAHGTTSDSDIWRRLRSGEKFKLSHPSLGSGVLVQSQGESWRSVRNGPISTYGGYFLLAMLIGVTAYFLVRGRVKVENPTGRSVTRFSMTERVVHWAVAILFVLLGVTGLVILYGKYLLVPIFGAAGFAAIASASLQAHNLLGPLFGLSILAMLLVYVKDNIPSPRDLVWLVKGGIFFRHGVPSGKYNLGEKVWFWLACLGGLAITSSGLVLDLPGLLEGTRGTQQLANVVHAIAALICIGAAIGHVYLGWIGVEGALDGMMTGEVDEAWAREHHSDWAEEVSAASGSVPANAAGEAAPAE